VQRILPYREAALLAVAFPASLLNVWVGQNGFVTAALLGGALALLPVRPLMGGVLFGLLSYKPQFGLLIPLVLVITGAWKAFGAAAVITVLLAALSWAAFGSGVWEAFFASLPLTGDAVLLGGRAGWNELQSLFGIARWLGAGYATALALQIAFSTALAVLLCLIWRRRVIYELKAGALAAAILLATPYVYVYDMTVLMIAGAYLLRAGQLTRWNTSESAVLGLAAVLVLAVPFTAAPLAFFSALFVFALASARVFAAALAQAPATGG
jgi:hypothetical protein